MDPKQLIYPYLVADIGGTNARFALVTAVDHATNEFIIKHQRTYPSADFAGIEQAAAHYIEDVGVQHLKNACMAVAGPVTGDNFRLTNLKWDVDIERARLALGLDSLHLKNDFSAYAYAIPYLDPSVFRVIREGVPAPRSPTCVLGPGTGFGVAMLVPEKYRKRAISTEAGHMSLAANNALQAAIKEHMSRKFALVSIERVFSGPGLRYLYESLAAVEGAQVDSLTAAEISQAALDETDEMCHRTLLLFCSWLGAVTGDLCLAMGARGGVYLGGGILPRIADFLVESDFVNSFLAKDQMSHYMREIPVHLVTEGNSALLGVAAWLEHYLIREMNS
jgi:glucokinase